VSFTTFEVYVNGERLCRAGGPNVSVLAGILSLSRRHAQGNEKVVEFQMGGMSSAEAEDGAEHLDWVRLQDVPIGTAITLRVVRSSEADPPSRRYFNTPKS
jgi:hypothetical protein